MPHCNICNKEIEEGYICVECANKQRKLHNQPAPTAQEGAPAPGSPPAQAADKPVASQPPQGGSGFSLNGFLKTDAPQNKAPDQSSNAVPTNPPATSRPNPSPDLNSSPPETSQRPPTSETVPPSPSPTSPPPANPDSVAGSAPGAPEKPFHLNSQPNTGQSPAQPVPPQNPPAAPQNQSTPPASTPPSPQQPEQPPVNASNISSSPAKPTTAPLNHTPPPSNKPAPTSPPQPATPKQASSEQPDNTKPDSGFSLNQTLNSNPQTNRQPASSNTNSSPFSQKNDLSNTQPEQKKKAAPFAPKQQSQLSTASKNDFEDDEEQQKIFDSHITGYGDEELEVAILSGIMKDNFILESLKGKGLIAGLFSTRYSRAIFRSLVALREENPELSKLDKIVIKNKLRQLNLWDKTVQDFLGKIQEELPPRLDQCLHYLNVMKEQALKRKLKEISHDITEFIDKPAHDENENLETFTSKVIQNVRNIQKARTTKRINLVREEIKDIVADMEQREVTGEIDIIGYSFEPMHYLNTAVSGFRKGFMYAIAGAPRRGKTTFTLELATRVATLNKIPVLFFTYEQTKKNLTYRLLAKESRLNPDTLQRKKIKSDMIADAKFMEGWKRMQDYMDYFYIVEATKEDTVDRIRSYAYNVMQDFNTEDIMIFVDYIQKMPLSRTYMDEKFKVEEISTELKGLSIELNNPIMTISSLSKEGCMVDATPDAERPTMYHCKGSGDLEYDLDCAMIQAKDWGDTKELYQQLQHKAQELGKDATRVPKVDVVNLYLDKNRDAPEGIYSTIQYLFFIEDNKFIELGPKFEDDRFRFSKIEELVDKLIEANYIIFYEKPKESSYNKGRVSIKLKNF